MLADWPRQTGTAWAIALALSCGRAEARALSFAEARAAAARLAPDVQLAERRVALARSEVSVVGAAANPTLSATSATHSAHLAGSLSVPIRLFGQRSTALHAAQAAVQVTELDVNVVRREARWAASLAFVDLWEAEQRARWLERAAQDMQRLSEIAAEKFAAGSGARLDVLRTQADRARSAAEAAAARQIASAAAARLAPLIGSADDQPLTAADAPGYAIDTPLLAGLPARLGDHPLVRRDRAEMGASEARIEAEQRQRWPILSPLIGLSTLDPTLPGTDVIFGLSLELPLLNQRQGEIARARAERALAQTAAQSGERRLRGELRDAFLRSEAAGTELRALHEQVLPAIQEAKTMTDEGYRDGYVDLLRVLDAQRALLDSQIAETSALAAWVRALADLEKAGGVDLPESGNRAL
jgi:cobalt-zinc-cadmium efflux system outer membrane protein